MNELNRKGRRNSLKYYNQCNPKNRELISGKPINTKSRKDRLRCYNCKIDCYCIFCSKPVAIAKINSNGMIGALFICPNCEKSEIEFIKLYEIDAGQRLPNGTLIINCKDRDLTDIICQYARALAEFNN